MWKILLLISLLPTVIAFLARQWLSERTLRACADQQTNRSGREVAEALFKTAGKGVPVTYGEKRKPTVEVEPAQLHLSAELAESRDVVSLGKVAALVGQALVAVDQPELLKWRQWVTRFGWAFPVFTFVVVLFAVVVAKVAMSWGIVIILGALGLASALLLASVMIEVEGAKLAEGLLDRSRVLPRSDDEENVARCCRAHAFRGVVPGAIEWLL